MAGMSGDWVGSEQRPPEPATTGGRRRGVLLGAATVVVVLVGGSAAWAVQALRGGGDQPEQAVPADVLGFVRIDLDPSAEQKINAVRLLRRVPDFEEASGISSDRDDLRRQMYDEALGGKDGCPDYEEAVEPWLGYRAGFGALPAADGGEPDPLMVVQVDDEDAARAGFAELASCTGEDAGGIAFVEDYALVAETQALADDFAAAALQAPLSDAADYQSDMDAVGGDGIVSGWLDLEAVLDETLTGEDRAMLAASGVEQARSAAVAMSAGADSLELAVAVNGSTLTSDAGATSFGDLPASTMFGFGFTGGADSIQKLWDQAETSMADSEVGELEDFAAQLEQQTGLVLPDDAQTLLGDDFVLALDSEGIELDASSDVPDPASIRVGLRTSSDFAAVQELTAKVEALLADIVPVDLIERESDRGSVVASNDDYAAALAEGGGLGDSENYQAAVADPDDAAAVMFVDFDLMLDVADRVGEQTGDELPGDARMTLEVLRAFGVSTSVDGDYTRATVRLVFD